MIIGTPFSTQTADDTGDAYFHRDTYPQANLHGMPRMGKILLFVQGAYFHSGMPIFTVKMGTQMPIFT